MANLIYANARAKALSKNLLGEDRLNRMVDAPTAEDAIKILSEVNFGDGISVDSAIDFEKLIDAEQKKFFAFLKENGSPKNEAKFFLLKNDFHNAEVFIKGKHLRKDFENMTAPDGIIDKGVLKDCIMGDEYGDLPEQMGKALLQCDADFVGGKASGQSVNEIMTKAYYEELFRACAKDKTLSKIYTFKVDCINIGIALRTRNFLLAKSAFLPHGKIKDETLKDLCEENLESLAEKMKGTEYSSIINLALEQNLKGDPLSDFEKVIEQYPLELLKKEKYNFEGNFQFLIYCFTRVAEINDVRIILVGLINGLDKLEIKRKLRINDER